MSRTRRETEVEILQHLAEIAEIYKEYAPESEYLSLTFLKGSISINNDYWRRDVTHEINADAKIHKRNGIMIKFCQRAITKEENEDA